MSSRSRQAGRAAIAGLGAVRAGARALGAKAAQPLTGSTAARRQVNRALAEEMFRAAAKLRGTALKLAQILHWEAGLLGDEASEVLHDACYRAPPMPAHTARSVFMQEFGTPPARLYDRFADLPFAAAGLGQVHAATSLDGERLAVKVQYPAIASDLEADLHVLRRLVQRLPDAALMSTLLNEAAQRLREECDYRREAVQLTFFRDHLGLPDVQMPEVYPALSAREVLTMSRVQGKHMKEWLADAPDQAARNHAATTLYAIYCRSLYELGRMHADPNPGNVLYRPDGGIGLVDFGCVKQLDPGFGPQVAEIIRAYVERRYDDAFDGSFALGLFGDMDEDEARSTESDLQRPFAEWLVQPMRSERFHFGEHPGYASEGGKLFLSIVRDNRRCELYPDLLFVNRTLYGLYQTFERLGAEVALNTHHTGGSA